MFKTDRRIEKCGDRLREFWNRRSETTNCVASERVEITPLVSFKWDKRKGGWTTSCNLSLFPTKGCWIFKREDSRECRREKWIWRGRSSSCNCNMTGFDLSRWSMTWSIMDACSCKSFFGFAESEDIIICCGWGRDTNWMSWLMKMLWKKDVDKFVVARRREWES